MKTNWPTKKLGEVLDYEQPGKYIVNSKNYRGEYKTPVLTAGKTFILGNTDEEENIFPADKLPVIIFDDFTTAIKFVDFPFKVKSSAMKILHAKKDIADVRYVFYAMKKTGLNHATHKRYWISEYSNIEIPLPPLAEQKKIVATLDRLLAKVGEAKKLRAEAQEATNQLLPAELHKIFEEGKKKGWEERMIREVCVVNPKKEEVRTLPDETKVAFVPMSAVSDTGQYVIGHGVRNLGDVRKGYTYFKREDVLFAKITPCMENGKVALVNNINFDIGFGSTEFFVVRAKSEEVLIEYIYQILRSEWFRNLAKQKMTGSAGQKRVPREFIENFYIFLPPLTEQKKIVARLDVLSKKIRQVQEYQQKTAGDLEALEQSLLKQAFEGKLAR